MATYRYTNWNWPEYRSRGSIAATRSTASVQAPLPASWEEGDDCFILVSVDNNSTFTATDGWTEIATQTQGTTFRASLFYKRMTATENRPTFTAGVAVGSSATIAATAYSFVTTGRATPRGAIVQAAGAGANITCPAIPAQSTQSMFTYFNARSSNNAGSPSSYYYEEYEGGASTGGGVMHSLISTYVNPNTTPGPVAITSSAAASSEWVSFGVPLLRMDFDYYEPAAWNMSPVVTASSTNTTPLTGSLNPQMTASWGTSTVGEVNLCIFVASGPDVTAMPTISQPDAVWNVLVNEVHPSGMLRLNIWWTRKAGVAYTSSPSISYIYPAKTVVRASIMHYEYVTTVGSQWWESLAVAKNTYNAPSMNFNAIPTYGPDRLLVQINATDYGSTVQGPNGFDNWGMGWAGGGGANYLDSQIRHKVAPTAGTYAGGKASYPYNYSGEGYQINASFAILPPGTVYAPPPKTKNYYTKHNGVWKAVDPLMVRHNGVWKEPTNYWAKQSGVWKKVYGI